MVQSKEARSAEVSGSLNTDALAHSGHGGDFPASAPAANPVFYRTYSRRQTDKGRETWNEVCNRTLTDIAELGQFTPEEQELINRMQRQLKALISGRALWVMGTDWIHQPENFSGAYNCTSTNVIDWQAFGLMMDLAMMGCGTGAVLEPKFINRLPAIVNRLHIQITGEIGATPASERQDKTRVQRQGSQVHIQVGDSRRGWVDSYQVLMELASDPSFGGEVQLTVDLSDVRPAGEILKGFGGVANPIKLPTLYERCAAILNKAVGRQLNSVECCLLIDEAASCIVAGNIRRCLPEDALVHTSKGLVPIQHIQVGDLVQTPLGFRKVVDKFDQGFQNVYEIETNATAPRATLNHQQAILVDPRGAIHWKRVAELSPGDRLIHNTQVLPGTITHLPADFTAIRPSHSQTAKPLVIPDLTPEVAWLIGFTHGDGYVALGRNKHNKPYGRVEWAMNGSDAEDVSRIRHKLDSALKCFGLTVEYSQVKGENTAKFICSSIRLAEYFHRYIKQPNVPLQVPPFILQGTTDIRAAYLAGLMDSDGAVNNRPPHLVTTIYPSFARQVGVVLSSLGIAGRMTIVRPQEQNWQPKYNLTLPALKERYNSLIAPHSVKGAIWQGLKMYGFTIPGELMWEVFTYSEMRAMGFQGSRFVDANYERYVAEADVELPIPVTVKGLGSYDYVRTFDIEVEEAHCFYCDGYLTHNSAGMRQFDGEDRLGSNAKDNLWQQDENGNWRIDPERDALRMANHTRVFHRKPTLEETIEAVRKQFYSGEGAIQWAGEAVARANCDLIPLDQKSDFLKAYEAGSAKDWLQKRDPSLSAEELEDRIQRYGLNPCVTAETWVHTGDGPHQVKDLLGKQHSIYVNGELFSTTPEGFFYSGTKPVFKLSTREGFELRLTGNHRVLKVIAQTPKAQYTEWVAAEDLHPGDRILLHNHRDLTPWDGAGSWEEGWLLGNLLGDGSLARTQWNDIAVLRYWQASQESMSQHAIQLLKTAVGHEPITPEAHYHTQLKHRVINSTGLAKLAAQFGMKPGQKQMTAALEATSYEFHRGFLRGLFDAAGSVQGDQVKGVSVRLAQSNLDTLKAVQRMLARLGIIATLYENRCPAGDRLLPNSNRQLAPYACKAQHELVIAKDNLHWFQEVVGFQDPRKAQELDAALKGYKRQLNRERFAVTVAALEANGVEAVYDCTVPGPACFDANGLVAHNCGEIIGTNYHCVAGDTYLITEEGMSPIRDLVRQTVRVWNGQRWSTVTPIQTGSHRQLYRVSFNDGSYLDVTEGHRFFVRHRFQKTYQEMTTAELLQQLPSANYALHTEPFQINYEGGTFVDPVYAYTLGQLVGDGSASESMGRSQLYLKLYGDKNLRVQVLGKTSGELRRYVGGGNAPCLLYTGLKDEFDVSAVRALKYTALAFDQLATWNREAILHFVAGLADADGSKTETGGIRIYLSEYERAYRVYLLLLKCGIRSSINLAQKAGTQTNYGIRNYDLWYLQITNCRAIPCQRLDTSNGHQPLAKGKWQVIRSVELLPGLHDTFCFNEPEFHKGVFGGTLTGQCNLSEIHLNQIDPYNYKEQEEAFAAGALAVAALLNHRFQEPRYQRSREWDPIVGVSFTGLFDFFVKAFGVDWLRWWQEGRPETMTGLTFKRKEQEYLTRWREVVHQTVWDYCDRHGLRRPNRCTTVQPAGTKSLLTGAAPGWHPPKAQRYIRRITFGKNDPVALACLEYGYSIVPSQSDKDENGNLLNDPFDPRCTEWLVELPVEVPWANLPGADQIQIEQFSALAQFDFYMQVQKHYTTHNTSATIELREDEVEALGSRIFEAIRGDEGYMSAALLARFDAPFPRLPFEKIDKATYEQLSAEVLRRRQTEDFFGALMRYDRGFLNTEGPAGCDAMGCLLPEATPQSQS